MAKKVQLVFIPAPGAGHLLSTVEMAKVLVHHDHRVSVTVLVMKLPFDSKATTHLDSLSPPNNINFIHLPTVDLPGSNPRNFFPSFIESQKPHVKEAVTKLVQNDSASGDSPRLAGFVLDMFCTNMMDIADEFGVPSYIFYTCSASFLGLLFYTQQLNDEHNKSTVELKDSDTELAIPGFVNMFPVSVLPTVLLEKDWAMILFEQARRLRRVKGIVVNTFTELQSSAIKSLADEKTKVPPVYTVGPILNLEDESMNIGSSGSTTKSEIMEWLDDQPPSSVVFLCFGSMGSFSEDQVKEIARALEYSGHRFLWSLRKPPPKDQAITAPSDYTNPMDVLPEGFLDRTAEIGKVIGWAPQASILAHKAIGGFVSHCGWNSTLESIWFGVPMATWPMYAEQQFNAFELVIELGLAVEIKMDYRRNVFGESPVLIVSAEEIERGIKKLMVDDSEIRKRMKEMSEKSRKALMEGGSSFSALGCFIDDVINNLA